MNLKELFTLEKLENAKTGLKWLKEIAPDLKNSTPAIKDAIEIFKSILPANNNPYQNFMQNNQNLLGQQPQTQQQQPQVQPQVQPQPTEPTISPAELEKNKKMLEILNNSPELLKIKDEILEAKRINDEKDADLIKTLENLYEQQQNPNNNTIKLEQELQLLKNQMHDLQNKLAPITPISEEEFEIPNLETEQEELILEQSQEELILDITEESELITTPIELEKPYNNHKNYKKNGGKN
jgi:hypothetical protein